MPWEFKKLALRFLLATLFRLLLATVKASFSVNTYSLEPTYKL
ncbi:hypothetical protein RintRC_0703 [Richelia intracellularis]|nr:hypothetical protein RintRC_0703 [Richelia intracellularis]